MPGTRLAALQRKCVVHSLQPAGAQRLPQPRRGLRHVATEDSDADFILSVLRAGPSLRDAKSYLASFSPAPVPPIQRPPKPVLPVEIMSMTVDQQTAHQKVETTVAPAPTPIVSSILDPVYRHTALVKLQGPFTDRQLESIARGMVYLEKLGLVSIIVVESDDWEPGTEGERQEAVEETLRVALALEQQGTKARPMVDAIVRLGPKPGEDLSTGDGPHAPEAHTLPGDLRTLRSALRAGEIPVLPPLALDSFCRSVRVSSNDVLAALAQGLVEANRQKPSTPCECSPAEMNLTPLRLMIVTREGGIPSYARSGLPHLLINLESEHDFIHDTFEPSWEASHPHALGNMALARTCLSYMPPTASAVLVSHRSPSALIGNLITNRPALSSSLPHALLQSTGKITPDTPTLLRRGMPMRVEHTVDALDLDKLTNLLETSFKRTLDRDAFYARLRDRLDYAIVAGDYAGAALVTREGDGEGIAYLDKFAVAPEHQGDGTVDFLWVALHDESYGLGLPFSVNPNGGRQGSGIPAPLVWRSRSDNPVNRWYFERSSGHIRLGKWVLFWCDAEAHIRSVVQRRAATGGGRRALFLEENDSGRIERWSRVVEAIPSSWSA